MNLESKQAHRTLSTKLQETIAKLTVMRREIGKILEQEEPPISVNQLQYLSSQVKIIQLNIEKCMTVFNEE